MARTLAPLFRLFTFSKKTDLHRMVAYLKEENTVLRERLPKRIRSTPEERARLLKAGKSLGGKLESLMGFVSYRTFQRWRQEARDGKPERPRTGRPRVRHDVEKLVLKLRRENGWGYGKILGELKKLGITRPCKTTVGNIFRRNGWDTGPTLGPGSWHDFIKIHAETLWACDFLSKKVLTPRGWLKYFVLFFIHVGSRRVHLAGITPNPNEPWMAQQARNFAMVAQETTPKPAMLIRDGDQLFTPQFDDILKTEGVETKRIPFRTPNMNAFAERWVQSCKNEALDHFVVFGESHLRHICEQYVSFYNNKRPHQSMDNDVLAKIRPLPPTDPPDPTKIQYTPYLGGLLKHYYAAA